MSGLMESWLDCEDYGVIERLDTEAVVTEFFALGFPIWPSRTVYIYNVEEEQRRIQIPLDRRSVALGYARVLTWLVAGLCMIPALSDFDRLGYLLGVGLAFAAIAAVFQFALGRLPPEEADRRALLRRVAGIGAPPEILPFPFRVEICEQLADRWYTAHRLGWREAIDRGMGHEILIALAEYHCEPILVMQARRNLAADLRWN
jgi:hypothetical protein